MKTTAATFRWLVFLLFAFISCNTKKTDVPTTDAINAINLKRGEVILCGPADKQFGFTDFEISASPETKKDFNLAVALLHSFEYDEAEKVFAKVIDKEPGCAMAYWGVAMSNFHPLWAPPLPDELEKGSKAVRIAESLAKPGRETEYIQAIAAFYKDHQSTPHIARAIKFEEAMQKIYTNYPDDDEAAIIYSLALNGAADPADKTYTKQKKAGEILTAMYAKGSKHPGVVHYIIHTFDNPELADKGLAAAREYASIAPASAHAQHMPSHIFTRLGLWDESIKVNVVSVNAAKCYAENTGIKGHWDEEIHGLDYLMYACLQRGDNMNALEKFKYLQGITEVFPVNFKEAYAFAAMPSRYYLENRMWNEAANMQLHPANFPWQKYPWQMGIYHFARLLGNIQNGNVSAAKAELAKMEILHDTLVAQKDVYKANQVNIQLKASKAWILLAENKKDEALKLMQEAAEIEDNTLKHPVTPCEVIPARELLGDMLMKMDRPAEALLAYKEDLKKHPNRFNGLFGAAISAHRSGKKDEAKQFFEQLLKISEASSGREEIKVAKNYLAGLKKVI